MVAVNSIFYFNQVQRGIGIFITCTACVSKPTTSASPMYMSFACTTCHKMGTGPVLHNCGLKIVIRLGKVD